MVSRALFNPQPAAMYFVTSRLCWVIACIHIPYKEMKMCCSTGGVATIGKDDERCIQVLEYLEVAEFRKLRNFGYFN